MASNEKIMTGLTIFVLELIRVLGENDQDAHELLRLAPEVGVKNLSAQEKQDLEVVADRIRTREWGILAKLQVLLRASTKDAQEMVFA